MILTNKNKHYLNLNFIQQRFANSIFRVSEEDESQFESIDFFKQTVTDRGIGVSGGGWTELLLQKNMQEEDEILTMYPVTFWMGLAKIGCYFALLNIVVILLRMFH